MGERFRLERSMRQGCSLALYLFLFFAKAMVHYLRARATGIRGVRLPIREDSELLDSEYADALYVQDDEMMLERVRLALEVFCMATGAKIKWNKSVSFLTDLGAMSQWGIFLGFRLIPRW